MPQFKRSAAPLWQRLSERGPALVAGDYGMVAAFRGGKIIEYFSVAKNDQSHDAPNFS